MAVQKALITNKADFVQAGVEAVPIKPFLYCNSEDLGGVVVTGTPTYVEGVRGEATTFNNFAYRWKNQAFPSSTKRMVSMWVKPAASDVSGWHILATNRGDGWGNYGIHMAMYNAQLNFRLYGSNGSISLYSDGSGGQTNNLFVADTLYHIVWVHDDNASYKDEVYVNGVRWLLSSTAVAVGSYTRSLTVGDMLSSWAGLQYSFDGFIDEFIYQSGEVWTPEQMELYRNAVIDKQMLDYWTSPGSLQLANDAGIYATGVYTWESEVMDLGIPFENYGRIQLNFTNPSACTVDIYTSTSSDSNTWESYQKIRGDGTIISSNERYIKVKLELSTQYTSVTPVIDEIQILGYAIAKMVALTGEPLNMFRDLASGMVYAGELRNAYDIIIDETINEACTLTFKLPVNDPRRKELGDEPVEMIAKIGTRMFIIREAIDERGEDGKVFTSFTCEAYFYELRDFKVISVDLTQVTAYMAIQTVLNAALPDTGWTLVRCEIPDTKLRDFKAEWKSVLECLRDIVSTWGGEIVFNEEAKEISLVITSGKDNGVRFYYAKNLKKIVRNINTYDLVTRLYLYGKGDLTVKSVNNNLEYIEDFTWVDTLGLRNRVRIGQFKDETYVYPQNLKDDGEFILADGCKPQIAYVITIQDLSILSGHEHESFEIGDTVYTVDKELLYTEVKSRIMRRQFNVREPQKTVVELAQPKKLLSDAMRKAVDDKAQTLASTDLVSTTDVKQLSVFNYLLNTRFDEGSAEWAQVGTGFGLDNQGYSGDWSYKCVGSYGATNQLTQRVFGVSNRSSYTISAAVATEGTITRGGTLAEPFVGLKVVVHYVDGTSEEKFLSIADTTE